MASRRIFTDKSLKALWNSIVTQLEPKCNGKHLSENDLTDELKEKILNMDIDIAKALQDTGVFFFKGSIKYKDLPKNLTENEIGYVYNILNQFISNESFAEGDRYKAFPLGTDVVWNGTEWDALSGSMDFSEFKKKSETSNFSTEELLEITDNITPEHEHKYYSQVIKNPTCVEEGIRRYFCIYNDHYYDKSIAATGIHDYLFEITKEETCVDTGIKTFTCAMCKKQYTEDIPSKGGHIYQAFIKEQPTCHSKGLQDNICVVCNHSYESEIDMVPHRYTDAITVYPTHMQFGVRTFTCIECGASYTEQVPKITEHSYSAKIIKSPTYFETGTRQYTCECGHSYTEIIPKLQDNIAPRGTISVAGINYSTRITNINFNTYYSEAQRVTLTGADDQTGLKSIQFLVSNRALTDDELNMSAWENNQAFYLTPSANYVVYAKLVDNSNNVAYINTNGIRIG